MDKKKILIIGSIVAILLSVAVIIYVTSKKEEEPEFNIDGINLTENKEILKDTTVNGLKIKNASLITRNGVSTFIATVSNDTNKDIEINKLYVVFYEGNEENQVIAVYDKTLSQNEETNIHITSETDLTNTTKIEYILE